jgi:hypothetical protein
MTYLQSPIVQTELAAQDDGTFRFLADGVQIDCPFLSGCGRFPVCPETYGFTLWHTGGNCTAWRRDFTLRGVAVHMLLTEEGEASHVVVAGEPFDMGVYTNDGEAWLAWTMRDSEEGWRAEGIGGEGTL